MTDVIRRPDLENIQVSFPDFIAPVLYPWLAKPTETGTVYYQAHEADVSAQYNRDHASLADINANVIAAASTTYSVKEVRARQKMGYSQVRECGGLDKAELKMARLGKRAWYTKIETLVAKQALERLATDIKADIISGAQNAAAAVRDASPNGKVYAAMSTASKLLLLKDTDIQKFIINWKISAPSEYQGDSGLDMALAIILGVDKVVVGKNDIWKKGVGAAYRKNIALFVPADENAEPDEEEQLGRLVYYGYDNAVDHFVIESWHDAEKDADVVDPKGLVDLKEFNSAFIKAVQIADVDESDSPSASN